MSTPTLRMLERQMAFKRQQEEARANRPAPTPDGLYRGARHLLHLDPAKARRFAGLEDPPPFVPPTPESAPVDWQKVAGSLMQNIEGLMLAMPRSSPRAALEDDDAPAAAPTAASVPSPSKPKPPAELVFGRDLDGRATHVMAGDTRYNLLRDINGKIVSADSDRHSVRYQRDLNGRIASARVIELKEPK